MSENQVNIAEVYKLEILEIADKLNQLEQGRFYENTKAAMDGSLSTNVQNLRSMLNDLFNKIQYGKESNIDKLSDIFNDSK